jgi:hypothetical protein
MRFAPKATVGHQNTIGLAHWITSSAAGTIPGSLAERLSGGIHTVEQHRSKSPTARADIRDRQLVLKPDSFTAAKASSFDQLVRTGAQDRNDARRC